jgi:hypothetical protein
MTDPRPSCEIYANRGTELYYICRELLTSGQLKGISQAAVKEFCSRLYEFAARRYKVESKGDMKSRLGYSPDHGDSAVVLVDVARRNGLKVAGIPGSPRSNRSGAAWEDAQRDVASLAANDYGVSCEYAAYSET